MNDRGDKILETIHIGLAIVFWGLILTFVIDLIKWLT